MQENGGGVTLDKDTCVFPFVSGETLTFHYTKGSKLPITYTSVQENEPSAFLSLFHTGQLNISKAQEELLLWHSIFDHFDIRNVQKMVVEGGLKTKNHGVAT